MNHHSQTPPWKPTACILCECNCGIEIQLGGEDGRRLIRFRGDRKHPASRGYACEKPHRLDYYQNGRDRLLQPQRRRADGTFETIDWDTAIREIAVRLSRVRDSFGGESIFYYGGGGQGNHLPGAYAAATRRALGSRYRSSALAQEKTGEFWVSERMLGTYTRADFEHCDVAFFLGKNPWFSHSIPQARVTLKNIAKDPDRKMIVVDPRRTKTAELADIHLQVRPGTDAWLLAAMLAALVEENLIDQSFLTAHTTGYEDVRDMLARVPIATYCEHAGVSEALVREAARVIGRAERLATFEDLGVQMNRHSTLVSYLHRLVWLLTGNFGKKGTQFVPTPLLPIADGKHKRDSPVVGARIIGGLVPCNVIADEILTDHEKRYRAMIVESANPAHSLADSKRMREALKSLDTLVVIDVAMTETAQLADYVLPAATQFEKAEATFFNLEFPENYFHLRPPILPAPEGPLPEAEIHARLVEELGALDPALIEALQAAGAKGKEAFAMAFLERVMSQPEVAGLAPVILYRVLGPFLPTGLDQGAVLLALAFRCALKQPRSLARAGFTGTPPEAAGKLFEAILASPSGIVFAVDDWDEVLARVGTADGKIRLALPDLLEVAKGLCTGPRLSNPAFPFVLSAGERRSFTANTIFRDPNWRKKDADGALRIHPHDAADLGVASGDSVRLTTARGSAVVAVEVTGTMLPGHISLPNGTGLANREVDTDQGDPSGGIAPNELTSVEMRDPFVGTPWHKHVPARLEAVCNQSGPPS
ncbi:Molybdopterin-dependent oxidoreductase [Sulfidibacter corallicola]|uniref:Molybdopterin-dependent oxidoreductase n=1 Tax=Sulfidibacter corallicola TaxID=2818388 RepID=A0A8A4TJR4_SULCO|nr:molybdopterin-dependent oxidoreductase [Sulfidibacter corallicola]QTD50166.1 molybdopterin-dependent oxidoreductase [Sulfidibacter corallicola]